MKTTLRLFILLPLVLAIQQMGMASDIKYVSPKAETGAFALFASNRAAALCISANDFAGVQRVARHLQKDIERVTGRLPSLFIDATPIPDGAVLIGTIGKSPVIDKLIAEQKLDVNGIAGKWETFLIQVIDKPFPGVDRALVIVGSDKRGTIFGMYDLSTEIGVSPWYWWADVPPKKSNALYVLPGRHTKGEPKVKYRGIFINDEAPALWGWAQEKFGDFNAKFYDHVFELILRLKGNFLWPAMWGHAFYDDDPENPRLADEYGVVISTSHHEPMMRAHDEWRRYGKGGAWNYEKNDSSLREFWRTGIQRIGLYESVVTLAMRGDGDEPMSEKANIALLEKIVKDQRQILGEATGKDVTTIPQVWALYKEVQEYYDRGMRVPDDVTLLLCDDNWGNIRKLPNLADPPRKGSYGIYYHYDFVGGPRNYKWLNTNQISRVWEQMHLAYEYDARQLWIVNVGDIKPMEFPISFFLDYAWNPELISAEQLPEYTRQWAEQQFGRKFASEIADVITTYTTYNSRRKPEMLSPTTYSLANYREAETVVSDFRQLVERAERVGKDLPSNVHNAYYQLVLHPVTASANLNELYVTVGRNQLYARQGRAATNELAEKARMLFRNDSLITHHYNTVLAGGKWNHIMDQTHIGYTSWQQPERNIMPAVKEIDVLERAEMGIAVEGAESWRTNASTVTTLPEFDPFNKQTYYIDVFNRGKVSFKYSVQSGKKYVRVDSPRGSVTTEKRLFVSVDWQAAPAGKSVVPIAITGPNDVRVLVQARIFNPKSPVPNQVAGFVESNGYVSMEAEHFTSASSSPQITWQRIPDLGRTLSAMTPLPVTAGSQSLNGRSARLEYKMYLFSEGQVNVKAYLSPTLNFRSDKGLCYGISFDDETPQIMNMHEPDTVQEWKYPRWWNEAVSNNIKIVTSKHTIGSPGMHVLKFWAVDPGVVLQKIVVEIGEVKPSYLGPSESFRRAGVQIETMKTKSK
ncbi:MAG: glycosyl hydrolase 115 family protein [Ignavibacteriae bacterium]|nr:glycosyl hydrolase 115 family protein [Ignavibacteriota bacterium]